MEVATLELVVFCKLSPNWFDDIIGFRDESGAGAPGIKELGVDDVIGDVFNRLIGGILLLDEHELWRITAGRAL